MSRSVLVVALLLAPAVAGCIQQPAGTDLVGNASPALPSAPVFGKVLAELTPLTASDGVVLDMWTFRPEVPEGVKVPVILQDSPYFGNADPDTAEGGQAFSKWLVDYFVPRGYAVVLKSVRGTGESGGCFGMGDPREALDGKEAVEWLAGEEWSNGNVAMIGKSYRGTTPIQTAILAPSALKTIVPIAGITEWYLYVTSVGGVPYTSWAGFNTRYQASVGFASGVPSADDPASALRYAEKLCPTVAELTATEARSIATGEYHEGWEMRNYAKDVAKMTASVYLVHGLVDFNVKPDQVAPWFNSVTTPKRAVLGQWPHEYPDRVDWGEDLLRWFDHELKGIENGVLNEPVVRVEDSSGTWRFETTWPPTRAETLRLVPTGDGALVEESAGDAAAATVAILGDPTFTADGRDGTSDRQYVAQSEPVKDPLRVAGIPKLVVNATLTRPHATLAATLYDVSPDGEWTVINWAFLDSRHRESTRESAYMAPLAEEGVMPLTFFPMDHVFAPGHRVAFALAMQHPGWIVSSAPGASADVRVGDGAGLDLPIVEGIVPEDPQPETMEFEDLPWYKGEA